MSFKKATKKEVKLTMGISGPAGAGKTLSALRIARGLVGPTGKIALIDTEGAKANAYADTIENGYDIAQFQSPFELDKLEDTLDEAIEAGYQVVVIDSLSHFYAGEGGILQQVEDESVRNGGNGMKAWAYVTPKVNRFLEKLKAMPIHVIVTLRSKTTYEISRNEKGKVSVQKLGLAPIWKGDSIDFEMDHMFKMTTDHRAIVDKTRLIGLTDKIFDKPDEKLGKQIKEYLSGGIVSPIEPEPAVEPEPEDTPQPASGLTDPAGSDFIQPVPEPSAIVPAPPVAALGRVLLAAFWRLVSEP
jgi:archaellum biogenesis ATPase FlaH